MSDQPKKFDDAVLDCANDLAKTIGEFVQYNFPLRLDDVANVILKQAKPNLITRKIT